MPEQVTTADQRSHSTASVANPRRVRVGRDGLPLPVVRASAGDEYTAATR